MQCIAKTTKLCLVCGDMIIAGSSIIRYSPSIAGSERHAECYGKPDKFEPTGDMTAGAPHPDAPTAQEFGPGLGAPSTGKNPQATEGKASGGKRQGKSSQGQKPEPKPVPNDPMSQAIQQVVQPMLENALNDNMDDIEETAQNAAEQAAKDATKDLEKKLKELDKQVKEVQKKAEDKPLIDLSVKLPDKEVVMEGLQHKDTPKLMKLIQMRKNVYLPGPAGSGKSTAARKCAEALGLPYYYVSLNPQSSPTRIEGYMTPHGEYVMTLFRKAYEFGGVFCADETDNSSANLWTSINNAIDSDLGSFPDGMVKRHQDFVFVGTGNTNLNGDAVYRDRKALDKSTISRLVFLYWDYDMALERTIALGRNPNAGPWIDFIANLRKFAEDNNPQLFAYATPRATYDGASLLAAGFSVEETVENVVWKRTFDDTAKKVAIQHVPLPKQNMTYTPPVVEKAGDGMPDPSEPLAAAA
jgi:cobaltochelatase CobS